MRLLSNSAIIALLAWLDASGKNAQQNDEQWARGFRDVARAQDALKQHFTDEEITGFIINKNELRAVIAKYRQ